MTTTISNLPPARRYYSDDGGIAHGVDEALADATQVIHALYTHWIRVNGHRRDFPEAVAHVVETLFVEHLLAGNPAVTGAPSAVPALSLARLTPTAGAPLRFYDERGHVNPHLDLSHHSAFAPLFTNWVAAGWHARDFTAATRDTALRVVHEHERHRMNMDGGIGEAHFFTQPFGTVCVSTPSAAANTDVVTPRSGS